MLWPFTSVPLVAYLFLPIWCQLFSKKSLVRAARGRELILSVTVRPRSFHFTGEEMEAQRRWAACLRPQSWIPGQVCLMPTPRYVRDTSPLLGVGCVTAAPCVCHGDPLPTRPHTSWQKVTPAASMVLGTWWRTKMWNETSGFGLLPIWDVLFLQRWRHNLQGGPGENIQVWAWPWALPGKGAGAAVSLVCGMEDVS